MGSVPGLGRSPGGGHGNPLQYSCLESPMDRGAWQAIVHGLVKELDITEWLNNKNNNIKRGYCMSTESLEGLVQNLHRTTPWELLVWMVVPWLNWMEALEASYSGLIHFPVFRLPGIHFCCFLESPSLNIWSSSFSATVAPHLLPILQKYWSCDFIVKKKLLNSLNFLYFCGTSEESRG